LPLDPEKSGQIFDFDTQFSLTLFVKLKDLTFFPLHSTEEERNNWRLIGKGQGIHWEDIDEDLSIEGLLAGNPSGESQEPIKKWLAKRSE
jgi:hypothetical protein